jgi:hypothetical protein
MRVFSCTNCRNRLHFENTTCINCGYPVGFDHTVLVMTALRPNDGSEATYRRVDGHSDADLRYCANADYSACNWLVTATGQGPNLCRACDLNRQIPDLSSPDNVAAWQRIEASKKRLVYSLLRFGLPFEDETGDLGELTFDFVDQATTGHSNGVITLDINEADSIERERRRHILTEPYRTLLGHLRHESGHYYWQLIVAARGKLEAFREVFGDERENYEAALKRYYDEGAPSDWNERFVSAYASAHAWEDWAETWAHYLHIVSAIDTADAEGVEPRAANRRWFETRLPQRPDPYRQRSFDELIARWLPLSVAMNSLSRALGHNDFYPFVNSPQVQKKLSFVHQALRQFNADR